MAADGMTIQLWGCLNIDGLVPDCNISSVLAIELL